MLMFFIIIILDMISVFFVFFFKQKTAYEMLRSLVGSEMCIRDRVRGGWVVEQNTLFVFDVKIFNASNSLLSEGGQQWDLSELEMWWRADYFRDHMSGDD
eukprot:TRINITY_DN17887_c0_g1_i1.p2 TRINITY_DN17887_c0_g1~~TRINITY_DN17887_c0_g1_i1.p2  ORF type:complete len:100 (+),score=19.37 TRINITY_DN17887_c0_g1_i1:55-354(+)